MQGRLSQITRFPIMKVLVDFDDMGYSDLSKWYDISDYVLEVTGSKEKEGEKTGGVTHDIVNFSVDNSDKHFNNDNPNSPYKGKIKSNIKFKLMAGFKEETLQVYAAGYIEAFEPTWKETKYNIKTIDYMKLFKKAEVPKESYRDVSLEQLINILCDTAGLPAHVVRKIPKTDFFYRYVKFDEENCFEALGNLIKAAVGSAYFEGEEFIVETKLALDYRLDTTEKCTIDIDDMFEFDESVDASDIVNTVTISSQYKDIAPLEIVWETPENVVKIQNEIIKYLGGNSIKVDQANLPIINNKDEPIVLKNITQGKTIYIQAVDVKTGTITIHPDSLTNVGLNDMLSVSYSYQQLALLSLKERKFTIQFSDDIDSINALDVAVWDSKGEKKLVYSDKPDVTNTVSLQSFKFSAKDKRCEFILKNNYSDAITISTLQVRGYPIKVLNPIEVYVKNEPSILKYEKAEWAFQNNYINNIKLAQKIGQFIADNYSEHRKKLQIKIDGFPELKLNHVVKVVEPKSGTNHKFTVERINYAFSITNGWTMDLSLLELDKAPWIYESFKGESWENTNSGKPNMDFISEISANVIRNGGAELYTGFADYNDVQALDGKHLIPDYWRFVRETGNATSRIRSGGNLVLHGMNSFEITTTNSGSGYYEQVIDGIKPSNNYVLTFMASPDSCIGKGYLDFYNGAELLDSKVIDIDAYKTYEIKALSPDRTNKAVVRLKKVGGNNSDESIVFDKVKLENSDTSTPYIETDNSTAVQMKQKYANSLVLGNNYGIEVFDQNLDIKVRLGQYQAGKYGLQIFGGGINIINGLPEDQISGDATGKWNEASNTLKKLADDSIISILEKQVLKREFKSIELEYGSLLSIAKNYFPVEDGIVEISNYKLYFDKLKKYLTVEPDLNNGAAILAEPNMTRDSNVDPMLYAQRFSDYENAKLKLNEAIERRSKEMVEEANNLIESVKNQVTFSCDIYSTNGLTFVNGQKATKLYAVVRRGKEDITDLLDNSSFIWKKKDNDGNYDDAWNMAHIGVGKEVLLPDNDIYRRATFSCDIDLPE
ncbi:putative tail fiber protein [Bacillus phage BSG01]|nr:putative tail fiber protein [Bacillus phage BSG01]